MQRSARHRDSRPYEQRLYRILVGGANLALAAMLFYGASRYFDLVVTAIRAPLRVRAGADVRHGSVGDDAGRPGPSQEGAWESLSRPERPGGE